MTSRHPEQPLVIGVHSSVEMVNRGIFEYPKSTSVEPHCSFVIGEEAILRLGERVTIYSGCRFRSRSGGLIIEDDVSFGPNCVVYEWRAGGRIGQCSMIAAGVSISGVNHGSQSGENSYRDQPVTTYPLNIGSNVWIGMNVTILPGVSIGDHAIIGAGSVVTRSIPAGVVAYGSPCRVIRPAGASKLP